MTKNSMSLTICFFTFFHFLTKNYASPLAPALYVFGDSLFDNGNNNLLPTLAKANYPPYGANFIRGATGRFTNGRTVADFIAEFLGLPYPPPYISIAKLDGSVSDENLTGLNYASSSCGILPETGSALGKCLTLEEQIDLFQKTVESSSENIADNLSKSIFVISVGSNDYINNYLQPNLFDTSRRYAPQPFAQHLIDSLSQLLNRLYKVGARKIIMFEIGPIGCIPSITKTSKVHSGECVEESNQLASNFNHRLPLMLRNLTSTLQGSTFVLGQVNSLAYNAIKNPSNYGLTDTSNPCCSTWGNGTSACIPLLVPCPNTNKHYFWDAYHLTEAAYSVLATGCIKGTSVCIPKNIKELVQI